MNQTAAPAGVRQLRLTVHADDFEAAVAFCRDALGMPVELHVESEGGAEVIASPTRTPWDSLNSRLETPGGIQLTLFEELGG